MKFGRKALGVENIGGLALAFGCAVIIVSVLAQVLGMFRTNQTSNSYEYNITGKGLEGFKTLGDWFPAIATIIASVVIIVLIGIGFHPQVLTEGFT